MPPMLKSNPLA